MLAGGVLNIPFDVNGYRGPLLISASATWTLGYEWIFYASLCVTALFARNATVGFLFPLVGLMTAIVLVFRGPVPRDAVIVLLFSIGMIAAAIRKPLASALAEIPQWVLSTIAAAVVALAVTSFNGLYGVVPAVLLGVGFFLIVSGTTLFGLLLTRPARRLGDISYGIYLLQGPVLALAFSFPALRAASVASPAVHWTLVAVAAAALTAFATVTHSLVERPGIEAGQWALRRITAALGNRSTASEPSVPVARAAGAPLPLSSNRAD